MEREQRPNTEPLANSTVATSNPSNLQDAPIITAAVTANDGVQQPRTNVANYTTTTPHFTSGHPAAVSRERFESPPTSVTLDHRSSTRNLDQALPPLPRMHDSPMQALRRARTIDTQRGRTNSGLDWIVPIEDKVTRPKNVAERLGPTLETAKVQRDLSFKKARNTGYLLNTAIGLQVLLGSLTTGLSAVATTGKQTALQTTILGGLTTIIASYLARQRGSDEPDRSKSRVKDLEKYIRDLESFILDCGHCIGPEYDNRIESYRSEYEEIMGNGSKEDSNSRDRKASAA